ncbi:sigma-54-dependent transcriptional regulator [Fluviispira multicolorata]|uniref:Response regulator n=1 Tax=Fluviispira multicolorata TaxID=2654512 RepID=A0A833JDR1_9BACT|nr:sigma 54-interacting transcriptional regulator [Fluviispira multicolorata]KAB8031919.1 response regulator [Fluviispira multicolorata]
MKFEELSILIVEDCQDELETYISLAKTCGLIAYGASTSDEAKQLLSIKGFDFLLTDIHLSANKDSEIGEFGFEIIQYALETQPQLTVLTMSHDMDRAIFERAFALGTTHFLRKPITSADEIGIYIKLASQKKIASQNDDSLSVFLNQFSNNNLYKIYKNGVIISSKQDKFLSGVAKNKKIPLVLYGETGTGKEEFAKILHKKRVEIEGMIPFVIVNCPLLDNDLTNSLLFGHKKGAFTGANETTNGYVAAANNGILFLDEVQSLDIPTQRKLLRVLNDGSYSRVGDMRIIHTYFQLIVATTKDLDEEVEAGRMLADFKYRISGAELTLDPLRDRLDDISIFISVFFKKEGLFVNEELINQIAYKCKNCFWKGNIRQLFRVLQRMIINSQLHEEDLNIHHLQLPNENATKSLSGKKIFACVNELINPNENSQNELELLNLLQQAFHTDQSLNHLLDEIEKQILINAIKRHDSIAKAHTGLGISRNAIDAKRKKYKI